MGVALCIGKILLEVRGASRTVVIPDVVDEAFSRFEGAVFSRNCVAADV